MILLIDGCPSALQLHLLLNCCGSPVATIMITFLDIPTLDTVWKITLNDPFISISHLFVE